MTIIVLIILALITIDATIGENGLFKKAQEMQDYLKNAQTADEEAINDILSEIGGSTNSNNAGGEETNKEITVEVQASPTSSTITINASGSNAQGKIENGTYRYYIRKVEVGSEFSEKNGTGETCIVGELEQDTEYEIKVECEDEEGNIGSKTITVKTLKVTDADIEEGAITFDNLTWNNKQASITIKTNTDYIIEYQINSTSGEWIRGSKISTIANGLHHGDIVNARLTDGTNSGDYTTYNVIDSIAPTINSFTVENVTENSITVIVNAEDNQSGLAESGTYAYYKNGSLVTTSESNTYKYSGLEDGTEYELKVKVKDQAGKTAEKTISEMTNIIKVPGEWDGEVNTPMLSQGMIPVRYDEGEKTWVISNLNDPEWYDYVDQKSGADGTSYWANVMLSDGKYKYSENVSSQVVDSSGKEVTVGTPIEDTDMGSMYVWIPRYAYAITDNWHTGGEAVSGEVKISFLEGNKTYSTGSSISYTYQGTSGTAVLANKTGEGNWNEHPAFNFGGTILNGIWVAKFEASRSDASISSIGTNYLIKIQPNVVSWRTITISNAFTTCLNMNSTSNADKYKISSDDSTIDPHMMKNSEWGAVAYLTQSSYGRNGNELNINNSIDFITGMAGDKTNSNSSEPTYEYTTENGKKGSTTGNVSGVYDMSGGAFEYVAAYVNNNNNSLTQFGRNLYNADPKYKDIYSRESGDTAINNYNSNSNIYGDSVYEVSDAGNGPYGWFYDYSYFPYNTTPFWTRGGKYINLKTAGIFNFYYTNGNTDENNSFRPVLAILK